MADQQWLEFAKKYSAMDEATRHSTWASLSEDQRRYLQDALNEPPKAPEKKPSSPALTGCLVLLVLGIVIWIMASITETPKPKGAASTTPATANVTKKEPDKIEAWVMAEKFVKDRLKSPSTADFGSVWGGTYQNPNECVTDLGGGKFQCAGWVDSQNAFGATIRTKFICVVKDVGNDKWRLESCDFF